MFLVLQVLDDQTFAALQSVMLFNNVEIVCKLQKDPSFMPDLFRKLKTTPPKVSHLCTPVRTARNGVFSFSSFSHHLSFLSMQAAETSTCDGRPCFMPDLALWR